MDLKIQIFYLPVTTGYADCWQEIYETDEGSEATCPICDADVSEWLSTHYPIQ